MSAYGNAFAKKMNGVATKLLTQFDGRDGIDRMALLVPGAKVWNPTLGEYEIGPDTTYYLVGVQRNDLNGMIDGTTIQKGDQMLTCATTVYDENDILVDITPKQDDKVLLDGEHWSIKDVPNQTYTGKDLTILYKLQIRK